MDKFDLSSLTIEFTEPCVNVYEFVGSFRISEDESVGLGLEQTIWRGVKIASGKGLILVVYVGQ